MAHENVMAVEEQVKDCGGGNVQPAMAEENAQLVTVKVIITVIDDHC
ncbi:hypothetical protein [Mucilaginibacter oryzae]|nr:hypothetical protein [Mucilaginibacter oryzae]